MASLFSSQTFSYFIFCFKIFKLNYREYASIDLILYYNSLYFNIADLFVYVSIVYKYFLHEEKKHCS